MRKLAIIFLACVFMILILVSAQEVFGQNSGALLPNVLPVFPNASGSGPDANGFVCTQASGTTTLLATYQDSALMTINQNPIRLGPAGRAINGNAEVSIFLLPQSYRISIYAAGIGNVCNNVIVGSLIRQIDNVYDLAQLFVTTLNCATQPGATASIQITNCANALPTTGGAIDTRAFTNTSWSTDAFAGITKPIDFICGPPSSGTSTFVVSVNSTIPANVNLIPGEGCQFFTNSGVTLTFANGASMIGSMAAHFVGPGIVAGQPLNINNAATVRAWPSTYISGGSTNFNAMDGFGVPVSCGGTTTACIQEAINAALTGLSTNSTGQKIGGWDLDIQGADVASGGAWVVPGTPTNPIYFPSTQGKKVRIGSITIPLLKIDSSEMLNFEMAGSQTNGIWFKPVTGTPLDMGKTNVDSKFYIQTVVPGLSGWTDPYSQHGSVLFDTAAPSVGFTNSLYDFNEINGGTDYGVKVHSVATGANFSQNDIHTRHIHTASSAATNWTCFKMGDGTPAGGQVFGLNRISPTCSIDGGTGGASTIGYDTYASKDFVSADISGIGASGTYINYRSGALGNFTILASDIANPVVTDLNTAATDTNLTFVNGNTAIAPGGLKLCATMPCTTDAAGGSATFYSTIGNASGFTAFGATTNASVVGLTIVNGSYASLASNITAGGSYLPIAVFTNGSRRWNFGIAGDLNNNGTTNPIVLGTNPALTGLFRVPNNTATLIARNAANSNDVTLVGVVDGSNNMLFGDSVNGNSLVLRAAAGITINSALATGTAYNSVGTVYFGGLTVEGATKSAMCHDDATNQILTNPAATCTVSSLRFKDWLEDLTCAEAHRIVMAAKPGIFRDKDRVDGPRYGFAAEEMAAIEPQLVYYEADGKTPRSIDYERYTAVLTKEFQCR